jgi:hypothetical protein
MSTPKKEGEPLLRLLLQFLYRSPMITGAGSRFQARAAAVAVSTSRCGAWCAYRVVVLSCRCPNTAPISYGGVPAFARAETRLWRRSWMRRSDAANVAEPRRTSSTEAIFLVTRGRRRARSRGVHDRCPDASPIRSSAHGLALNTTHNFLPSWPRGIADILPSVAAPSTRVQALASTGLRKLTSPTATYKQAPDTFPGLECGVTHFGVLTEIRRLQRQMGVTSLYVTHDQVEAMTLGDRLLVLHQGRPVQLATPMEVLDRPANTYVAGFVGMPSMNMLPATLSHGGPAASFAPDQVILFADGKRPGADERELISGIRPEYVAVDSAGMALRIDLVEPFGSETVVIGRIDSGEMFQVKVPGGAPAGETISVSIPAEYLHVFDAETGLRA